MSAENISPRVSQIHWFDPFPEPRTFPAGWDLSELYKEPQPDNNVQDEVSTKNQSNNNPGVPNAQSLVDK